MHCNLKRSLIKAAILGASTGMFMHAHAQEASREQAVFQKQDLTQLTQLAEEFLKRESTGHPGEVQIQVTPIDRHLKLAHCQNPQISLPAGSKPWGKTSLAISCIAPKWRIYVPASVGVIADYYVAALPLSQGHIMAAADLMKVQGDLTKLPAGIFTDPALAIGRTVIISMMSGTVVKQEMLRMPMAIQQGQSVTLKTFGPGFEVSTDAKALHNAAEGQAVQVKVVSGEVIAGIARSGGQVEVSN